MSPSRARKIANSHGLVFWYCRTNRVWNLHRPNLGQHPMVIAPASLKRASTAVFVEACQKVKGDPQ